MCLLKGVARDREQGEKERGRNPERWKRGRQ